MAEYYTSWMLLDHGRKHIENLAARAKEFSHSIVWRIGHYPIDGGARQMYAMEPDRTFPRELSLCVFDVVNALRSALDHAAYEGTVALGNPDPKQTKFPFGDTLKEARGDAIRRGRDVPGDLMDVMLHYQPYEKGNPLLWGLNRLRNTKVHRVLVPGVFGLDVWLAQLGPEARPAKGLGASWDAENGRLDLFSIPSKIDSDLNCRFRLKFDLTLGAGGPLRGEPAVRGLNAIAGEVQRVLMSLEAETNRFLGRT